MTDSVANKERLDKLEDRLEKHMNEYQERQIRQDVAHAQNMEAIGELTKATKDIVDAWGALIQFQKFIKWVSAFAVVLVAVDWISNLSILKAFKGG